MEISLEAAESSLDRHRFGPLGTYQTLLSCVPTATLTLTTQKILLNAVRLVQFLLEQLKRTSSLPMATERDYLRHVHDQLPQLRHTLDGRRILLDRLGSQLFPICVFQEYLVNGIDFLCYANKIDGVYSTRREAAVEKLFTQSSLFSQ